jgi:N-acetylglucosaminyl-diphospho-decaprenol L-rhamnosyltransferase
MKPAPILVLIVNYRTPALTLQAIRSIAPEIRGRRDAHVLIVDNGSNDGSVEEIAAALASEGLGDFCSLLTVDENLGFAGGNNAGLEHYRQIAGRWPDYAWLLNPDTIGLFDALGALVSFLEERPEAGLAGGRCLRTDGTIRASAFRFHSPLGEFVTALDLGLLRRLLRRHDVVIPTLDRPIRAEWLSGSHLMIRGALLDRIGLLDPRYFLYFEETDFCARAAEAGFEAWHVPASRIVHIGGQSTGVTETRVTGRRPRYWFVSRARFFLRRHGVAKTHLANLLWLLATPPGALLARLRGRPRHDPPRLWRDFLVHYYGPGGLMYRPGELSA